MTGDEWPPLVPDPPGQKGKLPGILPKIPSTHVGKTSRSSENKVVTLKAGSLTSAYHQLEKHRLQPVPVGSEYLCKNSPKMIVSQDNEELDWDLMRVAVPRPKGRVMEGTNMEDKALDGPLVSSQLCTSLLDRQMTVTMAQRKGRKRMTSAKKKQLENRSIFCGPTKKQKKKKKAKKPKVAGKDDQGADVPPEVDLRYFFLSCIGYIDLMSQEPPASETLETQENSTKKVPSIKKRKCKKRKVPQTLDLLAKVIKYPPTANLS